MSFLWLVLPAPGDPVLGHRGDDAMVLGLYWLGVGDLVEGVEPVVGALGQPVQQPRGGVGADVDDGLVGVVSGRRLRPWGAVRAIRRPGRSNSVLSTGMLVSISVIAPATDGTRTGW